MTLKKVKDRLNKQERREAFNRIRSKGKGLDNNRRLKAWEKEILSLYPTNDFEEYNDDVDNVADEVYKY